MAAVFWDIDGSFTYAGTDIPLPGAVDALHWMIQEGHQVIFVTQRDNSNSFEFMMRRKGFRLPVWSGIQNPRVVINDLGAQALNRETDQPWE